MNIQKTYSRVFSVVGVTYEGRQEYVKLVTPETDAWISPEPENAYDKNALAVMATIDGTIRQLGYAPRQIAAEIAELPQWDMHELKVIAVNGGFEFDNGQKASWGIRVRLTLVWMKGINHDIPF